MREITKEILHKLIFYDTVSGVCTWKERGVDTFEYLHPDKRDWNCKSWNTRFARKVCGYFGRKDGYIYASFLGKHYKLHRIIWLYMTGEWPDYVDHINGNKADNRWCNLRNVSHLMNMRNQKIRSNNTSGHSGVMWKKINKKWEVTIGNKNSKKYIGLFTNKEDAIAARKKAEEELGYL